MGELNVINPTQGSRDDTLPQHTSIRVIQSCPRVKIVTRLDPRVHPTRGQLWCNSNSFCLSRKRVRWRSRSQTSRWIWKMWPPGWRKKRKRPPTWEANSRNLWPITASWRPSTTRTSRSEQRNSKSQGNGVTVMSLTFNYWGDNLILIIL